VRDQIHQLPLAPTKRPRGRPRKKPIVRNHEIENAPRVLRSKRVVVPKTPTESKVERETTVETDAQQAKEPTSKLRKREGPRVTSDSLPTLTPMTPTDTRAVVPTERLNLRKLRTATVTQKDTEPTSQVIIAGEDPSNTSQTPGPSPSPLLLSPAPSPSQTSARGEADVMELCAWFYDALRPASKVFKQYYTQGKSGAPPQDRKTGPLTVSAHD
jgi:hypothetical protein